MRYVFLLSLLGCLGCSKNNLFFRGQQSGHLGKLGVYKEVHIWQTEHKKLDLLFVVNNSPAMEIEQWQLGEQIGNLLTPIEHMDWQAGIVEADYQASSPSDKQGVLVKLGAAGQRVIRPSDERRLFVEHIVRPVSKGGCTRCPRSYASPLYTITAALAKGQNENKELFRAGAHLVVFVLTNENEKKKNGMQGVTHRDVLELVNQSRGAQEPLRVYGLAVLPRDKACYERQKQLKARGSYALELTHLARATRGQLYSVCDTHYTKSLKSIGRQVQQFASAPIELDHKPQPNTLSVRTETGRSLKWNLNGNKLYITEPMKKTQITISYVPQE